MGRVLQVAKQVAADGRIDARDVRQIAESGRALVDAHGRVTPPLQRDLETLEREYGDAFTRGARKGWQTFVAQIGAKTSFSIAVPADETPFWLTGPNPLADFRSSPQVPQRADVVVVGMGLCGASAAYHAAIEAQQRGLTVVVLDAGDPANQASGRNGGNFELVPENFFGDYEGLAKERYDFLKNVYPDVDDDVLRAEGRKQAEAIMTFASINRQRLLDIVQTEGIACDLSPKGWLRIAGDAIEDAAIDEEVALAQKLGLEMEAWSPEKIQAEYGMPASFRGRFTPGDGTYHPFKYVVGVLQAALQRGAQLYTRTPVESLTTRDDGVHVVQTSRGAIEAKTVIAATNAFTSRLLPELQEIEPYQSQVMVTEHAPDKTKGRICTTDKGDLYFNQPRQGAYEGRAPLLMGGGLDRPLANPDVLKVSRAIHDHVLRRRDTMYPELARQPPSREWTGPMAFTPDRAPAIGELRKGLVVAAGFNGYGGSYTTAAGMAAARMAIDGEAPDFAPQDVFSPVRFTQKQPLFATDVFETKPAAA